MSCDLVRDLPPDPLLAVPAGLPGDLAGTRPRPGRRLMNAWVCDRCGAISRDGYFDDPPLNWRHMNGPVRGSEGARSDQIYDICADCDDSLYRWLHTPDAGS